MTVERRRLAAILAADVVEASRLMAEDEDGTLAALRRLRSEVLEPAIAEHGGRLFKSMGDGFLAEFSSAVAALACALAVQDRLRVGDSPLRLRVGVHQGDVAVAEDGSDLLGDGVNVAVRLEGLAEPGGVAVSARVHEDASGKLTLDSEDLGEQALKNIPRPIRVFRVARPGSGRVAAAMPARPPALIGAAAPVPGFGDRPPIAVLPFRYRGPDAAEQEHFVDGVTEEVINALARWRYFPVIARGSVFAFKGKDADPRHVAQALGARYVVDGTLRRRETRVRADASLVDGVAGTSVFSESYDGSLDDGSALEDEIARGIVATVEPSLLKHETERAAVAGPDSASAYNLFLCGLWHHYRYTEADNARARDMLAKAIEAAPGYAKALATLALAESVASLFKWEQDSPAILAQALRHAQEAARLDPRDPTACFAVGTILLNVGERHAEAEAALKHALKLDPSHAAAHANLALCYNYTDRPDAAVAQIDLALRLSPYDPRRFMWLAPKAVSHYLAGRYRDALGAAQEALVLKPDYPTALRPLLATLGQLGRRAEAARIVPVLRLVDGGLAATEAYLRPIYGKAALERLLEGLRKAGYD